MSFVNEIKLNANANRDAETEVSRDGGIRFFVFQNYSFRN